MTVPERRFAWSPIVRSRCRMAREGMTPMRTLGSATLFLPTTTRAFLAMALPPSHPHETQEKAGEHDLHAERQRQHRGDDDAQALLVVQGPEGHLGPARDGEDRAAEAQDDQ